MEVHKKIELMFTLLNFANLNNIHANVEDIGSITMDSI